MDLTYQLTPESARSLALRLFSKEQFQADPKGCIIRALDWLDKAAGDATPAESPTPPGNPLTARLDALVKAKGLEAVAEGIKVGPSTLRSWLRGVEPNAVNHQRIEAFLRESEASPPNAVGAKESGRPGELFGQPQPPEPKTFETDKQPSN
jgi:hypothetical protein